MPLIIQKYGGKSLASTDDIKAVAAQIVSRYDKGDRLAIVVSAMGDTTDKYLALARGVNESASGRELDVLLSVGERISIAMLALAINAIRKGLAVSLTGAQAGIITDTQHTAARIVEVRAQRVRDILAQGQIPVIAGYQGITTEKNISTLGRGGSDATAVALGIALGAERVEFMKDVAGVSTADPKEIPAARIIDELGYTEALELTGCGAKILQLPAVELAAEHKMPLAIGDVRTGQIGTIISQQPLAHRTLTAIVFVPSVTHFPLPDRPFGILDALRKEGIHPLGVSWGPGGGDLVLSRADAASVWSNPTLEAHLGAGRELSLVTLVGPGAGSSGIIFAKASFCLNAFIHQCQGLLLSETRFAVLLEENAARAFARAAHRQFFEEDAASGTETDPKGRRA
ncbi:MAG: aspartate kinase [bacterium]